MSASTKELIQKSPSKDGEKSSFIPLTATIGTPLSMDNQQRNSPNLITTPSSSSKRSKTPIQTAEEKLLMEYGLEFQELEKSQGQSVLPHVTDAVAMLNNPSSTYTLPQMLFLTKKLLTWYSISAPTVKNYVFEHHSSSFLSKIEALVCDIPVEKSMAQKEDPPSSSSIISEENNKDEERDLILQKIAYHLALLLSYYCEEVPEFKEKLHSALIVSLKSILSKKIPLREVLGKQERIGEEHQFSSLATSSLAALPVTTDKNKEIPTEEKEPDGNGTLGVRETPLSIRVEVLQLLIRCLTVIADDPVELQDITFICSELSKQANKVAPLLQQECLERLHHITTLKDKDNPSLMEAHFSSLMIAVESGNPTAFTILKKCSKFFHEESTYLHEHLDTIVQTVGIVDEVGDLLEKILEKNQVMKIVKSVPTFIQQISKSAMKYQLIIIGIFISIALIDVKPFLDHISDIFLQCLLHSHLFVPLCKLSAVIGKYGGQMIAIKILQELGKLAKSGKVTDPAAQSAMLEAFHIIKDETGYSNLLSKETLQTLETFSPHNPGAFQYIRNWHEGKRSRIGSDVKSFLVTAGTIHSAEQNANNNRFFGIPCGSGTSSNGSTNNIGSLGNKNAATISPSPFSQDLAIAMQHNPKPSEDPISTVKMKANEEQITEPPNDALIQRDTALLHSQKSEKSAFAPSLQPIPENAAAVAVVQPNPHDHTTQEMPKGINDQNVYLPPETVLAASQRRDHNVHILQKAESSDQDEHVPAGSQRIDQSVYLPSEAALVASERRDHNVHVLKPVERSDQHEHNSDGSQRSNQSVYLPSEAALVASERRDHNEHVLKPAERSDQNSDGSQRIDQNVYLPSETALVASERRNHNEHVLKPAERSDQNSDGSQRIDQNVYLPSETALLASERRDHNVRVPETAQQSDQNIQIAETSQRNDQSVYLPSENSVQSNQTENHLHPKIAAVPSSNPHQQQAVHSLDTSSTVISSREPETIPAANEVPEYNPAHEIPVTSNHSNFITKWFTGPPKPEGSSSAPPPSGGILGSKSLAKVGIENDTENIPTTDIHRPVTANTQIIGMTPSESIHSIDSPAQQPPTSKRVVTSE